MRNIVFSILLLCSSVTQLFAQNISGAYIAIEKDTNHLLLIADGYLTHTRYSPDTYKSTHGGPYKIEGNNLILAIEFDDNTVENVGNNKQISFNIDKNKLVLGNLVFQKQTTKTQDLDGLWRITGRKVSDNIQTIQRSDRKTIKILVDGYFQWIAINPAEKGFYGTGGGKYVFKNGNYQENILFFSRDNSRVGATLNFEGKIENTQWHHSGKSSKGDPIYEIWSLEK